MMIGMSAAIAQGVMGATIDVDVWVDLPPRQYMRVLNVARTTGAVIAANTVVYLEDGTPVNFVYQVTGLRSFESELQHTHRMRLRGWEGPVLDLARIQASKQAIGRDKDLLHIRLISDFLRCRENLGPEG